MSEVKNYAWPVTAISKENYNIIVEWARRNEKILSQKILIIFGAGIRGAEISVILESEGINNILFTDNNADKWGGVIDKYSIVSVDDALKLQEKAVFLVSVEEGEPICKQLESYGMELDKDYFFPRPNLYYKFIEEYKREINGEILVMGDCMFEVVSFYDEKKDSISDMLYERYGKDKIKLLTMHGMSLPGFYHMLKGQLNCGMIPSVYVVMLNFETLTGKQHLLPRSQHTELVKAAYNNSPDPDGELARYVKIVEERVKNVQTEFFTTNKYSAKKMNNDKGSISDAASKVFFRMNYLYNLDTEMESIQYLRKIMKLAKKYQFGFIPFVPPVNYERGSELFGVEGFEKRYNSNLIKLKNIVEEYEFKLLDLSHVCGKEEFAHSTTPDETTNYYGRKKIVDIISNEIGMI